MTGFVAMVFAPAVSWAGDLKMTRSGDKVVTTSTTQLDTECWTRTTIADQYELKINAACLNKLGNDVTPTPNIVRDNEGKWKKDGGTTGVARVLNTKNKDIIASKRAKNGPFLVFLSNDDVLLAAHLTYPPTGDDCQHWDSEKDDSEVVVNLETGSIVYAPPRNVLQPNHGLEVRVCRDADQAVTVDWGGQRGLTTSEISALRSRRRAATTSGHGPTLPVGGRHA